MTWRSGNPRAYKRHRRLALGKDIVLTVCFLFLLGLIALRLQENDDGAPLSGPFHVIDGDTLAAGSDRLRLTGIDAPELRQFCEESDGAPWACGEHARRALEQLLAKGEAQCRGSDMDQYHRRLVTCFVGSQNLNALMVRSGMAVSTALFTYRREQLSAEADRRGIWRGHFENPKSWRDRAKTTDGAAGLDGSWFGTSDW